MTRKDGYSSMNIAVPANGSRIPAIIDENCVGCNLCSLVCPVEQCITMERRDDGTLHDTWHERTLAGDIPDSFEDERAGGNHHWVPEVADAIKHFKPKGFNIF